VSVERLSPAVREQVRAEIAAAHGREVSFVARPDAHGRLVEARPVARGTVDAVLALPGIAQRGELLLHNHPSGALEPSGADLSVAARLHDGGVGFAIVDNDVTDDAARSLRCRRLARPSWSGGPRARGLRRSAEPT